jgi:hypothetical protein
MEVLLVTDILTIDARTYSPAPAEPTPHAAARAKR